MKRLLGNKKLVIAVAAVVILAAAAAVVLLLLGGEQAPKEEPVEEPVPIEAPIQYKLNDVQILAIPAGANVLVYDEEPISLSKAALAAEEESAGQLSGTVEAPDQKEEAAQPDEDTGEEEADAEEEAAAVIAAYRYEGMANASATVSAYTALLTTEDLGYLYAHRTLKDAEEPPVLDTETGEVYLIHRLPKPEDGSEKQAVAMCIRWEQNSCTITLELVPASMTVQPQPESESGTAVGGYAQNLTFSSAVDTIKTMHPSMLELDGGSMEDYRVYSRDGLVLVNGQSCMRIDIYKLDERAGTNVVVGNYFISADGLHLYLFDEQAQTVRELPMTAG